MPELYQRSVRAMRDAGRLEVHGAPAGPAGTSAVELPDGSVWEVDHADPALLVGLDVELAGDPTSSPLLVAAFGADGALWVAEDAVTADRFDAVDRDWAWEMGRRRSRGGDWAAEQAGQLVLLTDLATDDELAPLARVAAVAELAVEVGGDPSGGDPQGGDPPGGHLIAPLVPALLDLADELAVDVDDADLDALDPEQRSRLLAALRHAWLHDPAPRTGLARLVERVGEPSVGDGFVADGPAADRIALFDGDPHIAALDLSDAAAAPQAEPKVPSAESRRSGIEVTRTAPGVAQVVATRSGRERWVRVSDRDGLVLVAQSRLHRDGLVDRADVAVPDRIHNDDLLVQIVDVDDLTGPAGTLDAMRAAVRAGRHAARATRLNDRFERAERWERCAALWDLAGDTIRARQALALSEVVTAPSRMTAPLADEVAAMSASWS